MFDLFTMAAVIKQLTTDINGGRIQSTGLTADGAAVMEIYANRQRHYLVAATNPTDAMLAVTESPVAIDPERVTPFSLLLRKYCRGGMIVSVEQPDLERIAHLTIARRMQNSNHDPAPREETELEDPAEGELIFTQLIVEIMGRHSNIILVREDGVVLDALRRVPPTLSRARPILPGLIYDAPPIGDRQDPRLVTGDELASIGALSSGGDKVSDFLVRYLRGISPQVAREIVFRATGSVEGTVAGQLIAGWNAIALETAVIFRQLEMPGWNPVIYRNEEGLAVAYGAFPHRHLATTLVEEAAGTISDAVMLHRESAGRENASFRHAGRVERLRREVAEARLRAESRRHSIEQQAEDATGVDRFRRWGEAIYANLWNINPGQATLEWEGEMIPLEPPAAPKEVAEKLFERYRKMQGAVQQTPELIEGATLEVNYLAEFLVQLEQVTRYDDLTELQAEWQRYRGDRGGAVSPPGRKKPAPKRRLPKPLVDQAGNTLLIGRSGSQNDAVTFDMAGPDDLWLHARGVPGAHVILKAVNPAAEVIARAAAVAAWYSAARSSGKVEVDVTLRKHVRKIKGAPPGMVIYRHEETISVEPHDEQTFIAV